MAYNKAREEKKWRLWKEAEEKQLRSLGVSENDIEKLRVHDWAIFNSDRRYYQRMQETGTYLEEVAADMTQPEINTVEDFLDNIENQQLYQVLIKVDRLTLHIAFMKVQGFRRRWLYGLRRFACYGGERYAKEDRTKGHTEHPAGAGAAGTHFGYPPLQESSVQGGGRCAHAGDGRQHHAVRRAQSHHHPARSRRWL